MAKNKKKKDEEQEKKNPYQKEYGILSNCSYVLKKIREYCPKQLGFLAVGVITGSLMQYLWTFIGKFVIDIVEMQANTPDKDILPLMKLIGIVAVVELVCLLLDTYINNKLWYQFVHVRFSIISERIAKVLSMNYQNLEEPDMLDMHEKAS